MARIALGDGDLPAAHRALDRAWMRLAVHIRAEHRAIFPALAGSADLGGRLASLREDHDAFMATLARAVNALATHPADPAPAKLALEEVLPRLAAHNALEESQVYPRADALAEPARGALLRGVRRELADLPPRYRA